MGREISGGVMFCVLLIPVGAFLAIHFVLVAPMLEGVHHSKLTNCTVVEKIIKSTCLTSSKHCTSGYICILKMNYTDEKGISAVGKANTPSNYLKRKTTPQAARNHNECQSHEVDGTYPCYYSTKHSHTLFISNKPITAYYGLYAIPGFFFGVPFLAVFCALVFAKPDDGDGAIVEFRNNAGSRARSRAPRGPSSYGASHFSDDDDAIQIPRNVIENFDPIPRSKSGRTEGIEMMLE